MKTAFLVDAAFFLRRHRSLYSAQGPSTAGAVADDLWRHCMRHLRRPGEADGEPLGTLYRIFVYDCPPLTKKVHHPLTGRSIDLSRSETARFRTEFHREIVKRRNVALRLGYLDDANASWRPKDDGLMRGLLLGRISRDDLREEDVVYYGRQKGVDMKLGLDIASIAYKRLAERIVLVAGDSDFVPAAKMARREGIEFILDPLWTSVRGDLLEHVDGVRTTVKRPGGQPDDAAERP